MLVADNGGCVHYPGRAGRLGYSKASAGRQQFYQEAGGGAASFISNCAWLPINKLLPHFSYSAHMLPLAHMHTRTVAAAEAGATSCAPVLLIFLIPKV